MKTVGKQEVLKKGKEGGEERGKEGEGRTKTYMVNSSVKLAHSHLMNS